MKQFVQMSFLHVNGVAFLESWFVWKASQKSGTGVKKRKKDERKKDDRKKDDEKEDGIED